MQCKSYPESVIHSLFIFPHTINFWESEECWIKNKTDDTLNLSSLERVLEYENTDNFLPINVILLATKYFLFFKLSIV